MPHLVCTMIPEHTAYQFSIPETIPIRLTSRKRGDFRLYWPRHVSVAWPEGLIRPLLRLAAVREGESRSMYYELNTCKVQRSRKVRGWTVYMCPKK
jgi:hypothetical protein